MSAEYLAGMRAATNDLSLGNVGDEWYAARNPYGSEANKRTVDWQNGYDRVVMEAKKKKEQAA